MTLMPQFGILLERVILMPWFGVLIRWSLALGESIVSPDGNFSFKLHMYSFSHQNRLGKVKHAGIQTMTGIHTSLSNFSPEISFGIFQNQHLMILFCWCMSTNIWGYWFKSKFWNHRPQRSESLFFIYFLLDLNDLLATHFQLSLGEHIYDNWTPDSVRFSGRFCVLKQFCSL